MSKKREFKNFSKKELEIVLSMIYDLSCVLDSEHVYFSKGLKRFIEDWAYDPGACEELWIDKLDEVYKLLNKAERFSKIKEALSDKDCGL